MRAEVLGAELDVGRGRVLLEVAPALRARDRDEVVALREHPREGQLRGRDALLLGDLRDLGGQLQVGVQVLAGEARAAAAEVLLVELVGRLEAAREEAAPERRVGDEADPELAAGGQHPGLGVAGPQRVLGLHGGDGVDGVRAADGLRRRLAEPEVEHLARLHELGHRADGLLDRHVGIDAVLVVEVDVVGAEPLQRAVDRAAHVLGRAVERADGREVAGPRRRLDAPRELGGEDVLVAVALDRPPDELLVGHRPVELGRVEEVDPELQRALDRRDGLALVGRAVEGRHPHAPQAEGGDLERSELARVHCCSMVGGRSERRLSTSPVTSSGARSAAIAMSSPRSR